MAQNNKSKKTSSRNRGKRCVNTQTPMRTGRGSKAQRREEEVVDTTMKMATSNPGSWYDRFPTITNPAGTKAFADITGQVINHGIVGSGIANMEQRVPGVMAIGFYPAIGVSNDNESAINRTASAVYTYERGKLRLANSYDAADLMIAYVAFDSMCAALEVGRRVYGLANAQSPINKYFTDTLISACGFDPGDVRLHLDDLYFGINKYAVDISSFAFPSDIDLRKRHEWMCSNVYLDAANIKSQSYIFKPEGFWKWDNTAATGSQLNFVQFGTPLSPLKVSDYLELINSLITPVRGDSDFTDISGDFYNALGAEGCISVPSTPLEYTVVPGYQPEVNAQIENARCVGALDSDSLVISQNPAVNNGAILFQPTISIAASHAMAIQQSQWYLNHHGDQPSPIQVIEMTRLTPTFEQTTVTPTGVTKIPIVSCGADIPSQMYIYVNPIYNGAATSTDYVAIPTWDVMDLTTTTPASLSIHMRRALLLSKFDWAPRMKVFTISGSDLSTMSYLGDTVDVENSTIVTNSDLQRMHEAAMLSLFDFPRMGFGLR